MTTSCFRNHSRDPFARGIDGVPFEFPPVHGSTIFAVLNHLVEIHDIHISDDRQLQRCLVVESFLQTGVVSEKRNIRTYIRQQPFETVGGFAKLTPVAAGFNMGNNINNACTWRQTSTIRSCPRRTTGRLLRPRPLCCWPSPSRIL